MEKIAFILWVLLWPMVCAIIGYLNFTQKLKTGIMPDENKALFVSIVELIIWIWVARAL